MRRLTALLVLLAALLLAACAAPAPTPTPTPTPAPSPTPQPTATPQPPTPTPTATFTPSPTPLPAGLGDILGQLRATWTTNATYTPATPVELARLAQDLGVEPAKLGQVYRVEVENKTVFWASAETGQTYAIRQVPDYWKYENGEKVDVPAHEEVVTVEEVINDPVEFSHWGDGRVVKVKYEDGNEGWLYLNEQGEWAKIYESGFDYEFLSQVARHFEEVKGVPYTEWAEGVMGRGTFGAKTDLDQIERYGKYNWFESAFTGFFVGSGWIKSSWGNTFVVVEGFPRYNRREGKNNTILMPLLVGIEKDGRWESLIGGNEFNSLNLIGDNDEFFDGGNQQLVEEIFKDGNLGKHVLADIEVWGLRDKLAEYRGWMVDPMEDDDRHVNPRLSLATVDLLQKGMPDWGIWFASLSEEEQKALLASGGDGEGIAGNGEKILPWIVFVDTKTFEELLQKDSLQVRPVGFLVGELGVRSNHKNEFGKWVYP